MTGAYIRIKRDRKWESIEIDQLTDKEIGEFAVRAPKDGWRWAKFLAAWIRDNIKEG